MQNRSRKDLTGVESESKESDYLEEKNAKNGVNLPVVKQLDPNHDPNKKESSSKVHPFMAEGMQNMKRRHSSAIIHSNMDLAQGIEMEKDKENHVSPINFDENYLMFGGDKYKKVRLIPY